MSAGPFITQLNSLTEKVEKIADKLDNSNIHEQDTLKDLCSRLIRVTGGILGSLRKAQAAKAEREREYLSIIQSCSEDLIASGKLNNPTTFRRNIILFFQGPSDSNFDRRQTKARKSVTRDRCERIRGLDPDGIVTLAASFPPVTWAGGAMSNEHFDLLINHVAPDGIQVWSPEILRMLRALATQEGLRQSKEFEEFLKAIENSSRPKRRRLDEPLRIDPQPSFERGRALEVNGQPMIETAFLVPPEVFTVIWELHPEWAAQEPHTIILTIPAEDRVASLALSMPRPYAIDLGHDFGLQTIYKSTLG